MGSKEAFESGGETRDGAARAKLGKEAGVHGHYSSPDYFPVVLCGRTGLAVGIAALCLLPKLPVSPVRSRPRTFTHPQYSRRPRQGLLSGRSVSKSVGHEGPRAFVGKGSREISN